MHTRINVTLLQILISLFCSSMAVPAQDEAPFPAPPSDASFRAVIVTDDEPGERLVITGTVFHSDGKTPYAGLLMYFYQTDLSGVYNRTTGSWRTPRLHGWVKTDDKGRYELQTIKPGSYPNRRQPAHIHATVQIPDRKPQWLESFLFYDDPYLKEADRKESVEKGFFSPILKLRRSVDGTLHARRNIIIT